MSGGIFYGSNGSWASTIGRPAAYIPPTLPTNALVRLDSNSVVTDLNNVAPRIWHGEQEPIVNNVAQPDRCRVVLAADVPGTGTYKPSSHAIRFEIRDYNNGAGDETITSGYVASRCEVLDRQASPTSTDATLWPDPIGSTRWYGFSIYLDPSWTFAMDDKWLIVTQWKGRNSGSPPIELDIYQSQWRIGGAAFGYVPLINATAGVWHYWQIGIHFDTSALNGWAEAWLDGVQVMANTTGATLNLYNNATDPSYLKQGIYRTKAWTVTHITYLGPTTIGTTRDSVAYAI